MPSFRVLDKYPSTRFAALPPAIGVLLASLPHILPAALGLSFLFGAVNRSNPSFLAKVIAKLLYSITGPFPFANEGRKPVEVMEYCSKGEQWYDGSQFV